MKTTITAKIAIVTILALLSATSVFASGDKNRSTVGKGKTTTGSTAKGDASQPRTGR